MYHLLMLDIFTGMTAITRVLRIVIFGFTLEHEKGNIAFGVAEMVKEMPLLKGRIAFSLNLQMPVHLITPLKNLKGCYN